MREQRSSSAYKVLWTIFVLLVFEGALRKWISPQLSAPLIGLRDLLVLGYLIIGIRTGAFRKAPVASAVTWLALALIVFWGLFQSILGEGNPLLLIIGVRFWWLYLAFAVALANALSRSDFERFVRLVCWTVVLMAPLAMLQYFSPPGAWINKQVEGDEADVFLATAGVVRTIGTFTFTAGYANFLGIATPLIIYSFLAPKKIKLTKKLRFLSFGSLLICTAVSGSRTAVVFFSYLLSVSILLSMIFSPSREKGRIFLMIFFCGLSIGLIPLVAPQVIETTSTRFEAASQAEDLDARLASTLLGDEKSMSLITWLGKGIGGGSALATVLSTGERQFIYGEVETGRNLVEGGLAGFIYVGIKILVLVVGSYKALRKASYSRDPLPLIVWAGFSVALVTWSATNQLTSHGFLAIYLVMALFTLKRTEKNV